MNPMISKALLSGLGLASLTKDAIQKTAEDLIKKSDLSEEEGKKIVKVLHQRSAKAQKTMEKSVETALNKLLKSLHLAVIHDLPKRPAAKSGAKLKKRASASKAKAR